MAHYYRGEVAHRRFTEAPVRLPDDQLVADLEAKRVLAVQAYDHWKESLGFKQAYWATASGYQMSQIFVELWEAHVKAPYPEAHRRRDARRSTSSRSTSASASTSTKALEGHRMNVELAKAYGVDTPWSKGCEQRAVQIMEMLAKDHAGQYVTPGLISRHVRRGRRPARRHSADLARPARANCRGMRSMFCLRSCSPAASKDPNTMGPHTS